MGRNNSREHMIGLRPTQLEVCQDPARFRVLVAGRRFGKTQLALTEMFLAAQKKGAKIWYVAPSYRQAKAIAWNRLKKMSKIYWLKPPSETELTVHLTFGSSISLRGADRPDSLRGSGLDLVVLDEFASMRAETWNEVLRPALSDRKGRALFIGTPKGHNHFFEAFQYAKSQSDPEWAAFQFTTAQGGVVDAAELSSAAKQLDPESFRQEYEAEFTGAGRSRVYYAFSHTPHVKPLAFDPARPLGWTIDFNVNPMCMLLVQRLEDDTVHVLDEIILKNTNTEEACKKFHERIPSAAPRPLAIQVYGDASGNQRRTSGTTTDWSIIRNFFSLWRGTYNHSVHVNNVNPAVRDRVNCLNSRLLNTDGEARLFIDPRCTELIRDLDQVTWHIDSNGLPTSDINKSDPNRTHASDALGYFIAQAFPLRPLAGPKSSGPLF